MSPVGPDRDFLGYGEHPPVVRWPGGARIAVSLVLNIRAELSLSSGDERIEAVHAESPAARPRGRTAR